MVIYLVSLITIGQTHCPKRVFVPLDDRSPNQPMAQYPRSHGSHDYNTTTDSSQREGRNLNREREAIINWALTEHSHSSRQATSGL